MLNFHFFPSFFSTQKNILGTVKCQGTLGASVGEIYSWRIEIMMNLDWERKKSKIKIHFTVSYLHQES